MSHYVRKDLISYDQSTCSKIEPKKLPQEIHIRPCISVRSPDTALFCLRRIYPFLLAMCVLIVGFIFQGRQFRLLYERIRNER